MPEISLLTAFLAGLLGGAHCVGMCGGIVAAMSFQSGGRRQPVSFHLGYNLGRIASYSLAGALAGLVGSAAFLSDTLLPIQKSLYILAQVILILMGLYLAGLNRAVLWLEKAGSGLWTRLQPLFGRLLPIRDFPGAVIAGAVWGWLPCGLVYSALATAMTAGSAWRGAATMLAFGLGTLPNLLLAGLLLARFRRFAQLPAVRLGAGILVGGFGLYGLARAAGFGGLLWHGLGQ